MQCGDAEFALPLGCLGHPQNTAGKPLGEGRAQTVMEALGLSPLWKTAGSGKIAVVSRLLHTQAQVVYL